MMHFVLGTKAQLIKMAPVMAVLQNKKIEYNFIFTGQHQETIDRLLDNFKIKKPDYTLYSGKDITGIFQMGAWIVKILLKTIKDKKQIFRDDKKGIVLIHGDTFSALLGALMGKFAKLKVGHIESGLRSFNLFSPFPEEITRILAFNLSDYYFCPNIWALNNLKKYNGIKVNTKGNTLLDSLRLAIKNQKDIKLDLPKEKYCVATIHRFENIFNKKQFRKVIDIISLISKKIKVLFILHPPTKKQIEKQGLENELKKNQNIELRPRYDYFEFIKLINNSEFVISDGGSNQEECYYLGKPCLLLRNKTERNEGLGENVVLSKFNDEVIEDFTKNYKKFRTKMITKKGSPSKVIVKKTERFKGRK